MAKSLLQTNPYLRDHEARRAALLRSAASSSAVEGIRKPFEWLETKDAAITRRARQKPSTSAG
jgi:hypothetical protein